MTSFHQTKLQMNSISITTIIIGSTLAKLYGAPGFDNNTLVSVISAFRAALKADHKRVPACDLKLIEMARAIRNDFGYLVEVA
jgi:hypothetical protein